MPRLRMRNGWRWGWNPDSVAGRGCGARRVANVATDGAGTYAWRMTEQEESWSTFLRDMEGRPATVILNHSWLESGPESGRRTLVRVAAPLQSADSVGLPSAEELNTLADLDDVLVEATEKSGDAVFVAMMAFAGERSWYFFTKRAAATLATIESITKTWKPYKATSTTIEDSDGETFIETVCPTSAEIRWNGDMLVIEQLREGGDDMTSPREIEHFAYFEDAEAAEEFAEWCTENEFSNANMEEGEDGEFLVSFSHNGSPDIDEIFDRTSAADEAASELGGMYDGWETQIVKGG